MPVENGGVGGGEGTPDVEAAKDGRTAWIETKFWHRLTQRALSGKHPVKLTDRQFRPAQRVWHTLRHRAGCKSYVYVVLTMSAARETSTDGEWYLFLGIDAAQHLGVDWTLAHMRDHNLLPRHRDPLFFTRPTTKELLQCLLLSP